MRQNKKQQFAASRAHVWLRCTASEENQAAGKNRFSPRSAEADEGTLIHARAARMLGKDLRETRAEFQLFARPDSDAESVVDFYVGVVKRYAEGKGRRLWIEENFTTETRTRKFAVTPDAVLWDEWTETLTIFDLKTGFVSVGAEDNEQLAIGAHAAAEKLKLKPARMVGVIVQPRLYQISTDEIFYDPDFFKRLDAELKERSGRYVPGAHCKNCGLLTVCETFRQTLEKYLDPSHRDGLTSRPDEWARTLAIAGPGEKYFKQIQSEAKEFLELGGEIPGFALGRTGGQRYWHREQPVDDIAIALGLSPDDMFEPPKQKSVAQVEKLVKREAREKLAALCYQPQNKTLIVTDNKSFLAREGEKIIRVDTGLGEILKGKVKGNGKRKQKGN